MARPVEDGALLQAYVSAGDQEAFAELVHRHAPMVHGVCRDVLGDSVNADDAVQETFLALMRRAPELDPAIPLGGWLRVTATSSARQLRRSQVRRQRREQLVAHQQPESYEDPTPVEEQPAIGSALHALPAEQRKALLLRYVDQHSEEEAARIAGCPQRTLHNRVMAGLEKMRFRLRERGLEVSTTAMVAMIGTSRLSPVVPIAPVIGPAAGHGVHLSALAKGAIAAGLLTGAAVTVLAVAHQRAPTVPAPAPAPVVEQPVMAAPPAAPPGEPIPPAAASADPSARIFTGAERELTALTYTSSGQLVAAGYDRELFVWQPPTTTPSATQLVPGAGIRACALAADGHWAAVGNQDHAVRLWDLDTQQVRATLIGHTDDVTDVAISPDGRHVASTGKDGQLLIWDAASGAREATCVAGTGWACAVAWSPDGRTVASVGDDAACTLWDPATGQRLRTLRGHTSSLRAVAWSADGATLASAGGDGQVLLWDAASGIQVRRLATAADVVMAVALSSDGRLVAACDRGGGLWLWSRSSGALVRHLLVPGTAFNALAFAPDLAHIAATGTDGAVHAWATADLQR